MSPTKYVAEAVKNIEGYMEKNYDKKLLMSWDSIP
jgi:hypothetical protein